MIALAIALAAAPAAAPPADGYIQVYNYPSEDSCASWTADRARKDQTLEA